VAKTGATKKRAGKSARGKKSLNRGKILKAALRLADSQGIEQLSMRKLAKTLNVEAMSLYNHVASKDKLIDGLLDHVVSEFELPRTDQHWQTAMRVRAVSAHQVLMKHPWAALLMLSRVNVGQSILAWTDATIGCLRALHKINEPVSPMEYADSAQKYLPQIPQDTYPYLNAMATQIADGSHSGINDFEFGLNLILDGLERLRVSSTS